MVTDLVAAASRPAPALLHQGEAAFALAAEETRQRVAAFRVDFEFTAAGLSHRDEHAQPGAHVGGISQERQVLRPLVPGGSALFRRSPAMPG